MDRKEEEIEATFEGFRTIEFRSLKIHNIVLVIDFSVIKSITEIASYMQKIIVVSEI